MPLQIPTRASVVAALQGYIRAALPSLDPTTQRRSGIGALVKSIASSQHDWFVALKDYGDKQPFPQSATGSFLTGGWWRNITKLDPLPASAAVGTVVLQGTAGTAVPAGTQLTSNGVIYTTDAATAIVSQSLNITSLVYDAPNNRVVASTASAHLLASGMTVTISGVVNDTSYNGAWAITVTDDAEFTWTPNSVPTSTPAVGTMQLAATWGSVRATAGVLGVAGNLSSGGSQIGRAHV